MSRPFFDAKFAKKIEWITLYMGNNSAKSKLTVLVKVLTQRHRGTEIYILISAWPDFESYRNSVFLRL